MGQAKKKASTRAQYSDEYKAKAIDTWNKARSMGKGPVEAAKAVGITASTLYAWASQAKERAAGKPNGHAKPHSPRSTHNVESVARLEQEIALLREEKEILKKTIQIFARRST
jgi:transposase-like protein